MVHSCRENGRTRYGRSQPKVPAGGEQVLHGCAKWKKRETAIDLTTGPEEAKSTVLSIEEEAIIVALSAAYAAAARRLPLTCPFPDPSI